jgi:hypothetical protein
MEANVSEADRVNAAVEAAIDSVDAGDRPRVAADWAAKNYDVLHRREDVHERVQEAVDDD